MTKIILHTCCAPCLSRALVILRAEFAGVLDLHLLWFNPNIHLLIEYRRRLKALQIYLERDHLPIEIIDEYGLQNFCARVTPNFTAPARCTLCYEWRLQKTAEVAQAHHADFFATTLMASNEQDHSLLQSCGEKIAQRNQIPFLYRDCRKVNVPPKLLNGLYKQSYCGCVFSEAERYQNTKLHLYRNDENKGN